MEILIRLTKLGNNFYYHTKEISQKELLELVSEKDCLVTKIRRV